MLRPALASLVLLSACAARTPVAPSQFLDPARAPSGNSLIEQDIARGERLAALTDAEWAALDRAATTVADPAVLSDYVLSGIGRGQLQAVANRLLSRATEGIGDEARAADVLGLLMSHSRWDLCAQTAEELLNQEPTPGGFLVRALCFERAGDPARADENLRAAAVVGELDAEVEARLDALMERRAAPTDQAPLGDAEFEELRLQLDRHGILGRLYLQHLAERFDGGETGTLQVGGAGPEAIRTVAGSRSASYRYCLELAEHESQRGGLTGTAVVQFVIGPLGETTRIDWPEMRWSDHPGAERLQACLHEQVQKLRFPPPRFGRPQVGQYRFSFGSVPASDAAGS